MQFISVKAETKIVDCEVKMADSKKTIPKADSREAVEERKHLQDHGTIKTALLILLIYRNRTWILSGKNWRNLISGDLILISILIFKRILDFYNDLSSHKGRWKNDGKRKKTAKKAVRTAKSGAPDIMQGLRKGC